MCSSVGESREGSVPIGGTYVIIKNILVCLISFVFNMLINKTFKH